MPQPRPSPQIIVDADPEWQSVYGRQKDSAGRALFSALVTLALGVLGSTVLPVPYAFSKTGILAGLLTMLVVAFANDRTCCMMIESAAATGLDTYEELAMFVGGPKAKVFTQISLILLLFGTLCGGLAFLSDVARIMVLKGLAGRAPVMLQQDGRPVMIATVLLVLLPLCLQRHIRQFEKAATAGVVVVVVLMALIISEAVSKGFPAVASGELPLLALKVDAHLPEAFAVFGFAFYMQPMLMPLLREMPTGPLGTKLTARAVHITLYGVALGTYGTVGVFGASIFGDATASNIMTNDLLDAPGPTLAMYAALLLYLCCGMVTTHYALRASLDMMLVGAHAPYRWTRQALETVSVLGCSMAVAIAFPTQAEKIFALTGCTAVCLVCYVIPVSIHLTLLRMGLKTHGSLPAAKPAVCPHCSLAPEGHEDQALAGNAAGDGAGRGSSSSSLGAGKHAIIGASAAADAYSLRTPLLGSEDGVQAVPCAQPQAKAGGCNHCSSAIPSPLATQYTGDSDSGGGSGGGAVAYGRLTLQQLAMPGLIVVVGVGFSCAGIWVAVQDLRSWLNS